MGLRNTFSDATNMFNNPASINSGPGSNFGNTSATSTQASAMGMTATNFPTSPNLPQSSYPDITGGVNAAKDTMYDHIGENLYSRHADSIKSDVDNNMRPGGKWDFTKRSDMPGLDADGNKQYGLFSGKPVNGDFMQHHLYGSAMGALKYTPNFGLNMSDPLPGQQVYDASDVPQHFKGDLNAVASGHGGWGGDHHWTRYNYASNAPTSGLDTSDSGDDNTGTVPTYHGRVEEDAYPAQATMPVWDPQQQTGYPQDGTGNDPDDDGSTSPYTVDRQTIYDTVARHIYHGIRTAQQHNIDTSPWDAMQQHIELHYPQYAQQYPPQRYQVATLPYTTPQADVQLAPENTMPVRDPFQALVQSDNKTSTVQQPYAGIHAKPINRPNLSERSIKDFTPRRDPFAPLWPSHHIPHLPNHYGSITGKAGSKQKAIVDYHSNLPMDNANIDNPAYLKQILSRQRYPVNADMRRLSVNAAGDKHPLYLIKPAANSFELANKEHIEIFGKPISVVSAYRTYEKQKQLYAAKKALEKHLHKKISHPVAKPGSSPHNFGYAIDINRSGYTIKNFNVVVKILKKHGFINDQVNDRNHFDY